MLKKTYRRFIPALLSASLMCASFGTTAFADTAYVPVDPWIEDAPAIEVVDGANVVFTSESLGKDTLVLDVVGVRGLQVPGDVISGSFTVTNNAGKAGTLYMAASAVDNDVLAQIDCVIKSREQVVYEGALDHVEWKEAANLGALADNATRTIEYTLSIPTSLGNEVAYTEHDFSWDLQLIADDDSNIPGGTTPGGTTPGGTTPGGATPDAPGGDDGSSSGPGGNGSSVVIDTSVPENPAGIIKLLQTGDILGVVANVLFAIAMISVLAAGCLAYAKRDKD